MNSFRPQSPRLPPAFREAARSPLPPRARVAVVGAGVAGLAAALLLSRRHEVDLFERDAGSAVTPTPTRPNTTGARARPWTADFLVFNARTYPSFMRLIGELGVERQTVDMSFSVAAALPAPVFDARAGRLFAPSAGARGPGAPGDAGGRPALLPRAGRSSTGRGGEEDARGVHGEGRSPGLRPATSCCRWWGPSGRPSPAMTAVAARPMLLVHETTTACSTSDPPRSG